MPRSGRIPSPPAASPTKSNRRETVDSATGPAGTSERPYEDALRRTLGVLDRLRIRFALIGGVAVNLLGALRTTEDADFIVDVPALRQPELLEALAAEGASFGETDLGPRRIEDLLRDWSQDGLTCVFFGTVRIDLLRPIDPLHREALDRARPFRWDRFEIRVPPPEYIILDKLIAGRPKDLEDVRRLAAVFGNGLDRGIIDPWLGPIERSGGIAESEARGLLQASD